MDENFPWENSTPQDNLFQAFMGVYLMKEKIKYSNSQKGP
jgi:hypothetical protein